MLILDVAEFKVEYHAECAYDALAVYDGASASAHMLHKLCGAKSQLPGGGVINTTHNVVYLWFRSDVSNSGDGFLIHWTSATPGEHFSTSSFTGRQQRLVIKLFTTFCFATAQ